MLYEGNEYLYYNDIMSQYTDFRFDMFKGILSLRKINDDSILLSNIEYSLIEFRVHIAMDYFNSNVLPIIQQSL